MMSAMISQTKYTRSWYQILKLVNPLMTELYVQCGPECWFFFQNYELASFFFFFGGGGDLTSDTNEKRFLVCYG